ncbi:YncE family protein [Rhodococcoides kroppenstedtii]|uniref:YncE family protein n=1 Tax=Rhodococcoides kroppenstedtii TaxID=293050 RepID=UPI001BDE86F5|nr:YncE family protein [Rhodococcus kroppenstedtii]MBT1194039.1 YncE family protein [Rhodococcus kroppenstedtii]
MSATIDIPGRLEGNALSPDGKTAFVTRHTDESTDGTLFKIDTATWAVVQSVTAEGFPIGLAVSRDGETLYMGNNGATTLSIVDARTLVTREIVPTCEGPLGLALTPDGSKVVVACQFDGNVLVYDTRTKDVAQVRAGERSLFVALSPDGKTAYTTDLLGDYSIAVIDLATTEVTRRIPTGRETAFSIEVADGGRTLFATSGGSEGYQLQKIDIVSGTAQKLTLDSQYAGLLDVAPDGSVVFVLKGDAVDVVDARSLQVIDTVPVPFSSQVVAVAPDSRAAYVTSQASTISVITDITAPTPTPMPPTTGSGSGFGS